MLPQNRRPVIQNSTSALIVLIVHLPLLTFAHFKDYEDLSYTFSEDTIYYPRQRPFNLSKDHIEGQDDPSNWYAAYSFCMGEHGGTHLDAPIHFYQQGWTVEQIPAEYLIDVPGAVIDIEGKVNSYGGPPAEYALTVQDILEHEEEFGPVPNRGLVLVHTGWGKYWGNRTLFLGVQADGVGLRFPGISEEAAHWLYNERSIVGIGLDTASVDPGHLTGPGSSMAVHRFFAKMQMYILENVAHMHLITKRRMSTCRTAVSKNSVGVTDSENGNDNSCVAPTANTGNFKKMCRSFTFFILPLKIVSGTGSPTRILARCDP